MARGLTTKFLATALALSPLMLAPTALPAAAQVNFSVNIGSSNRSVSFGYFYNALAPYGRWYHHPRWGDVWHPVDVPRDFRPYYRGHWDYAGQYGWLWESDYEWGDTAFHYGRWVYDPYDGWLWIPGYVWAPAWVIWREGGGNIGWFPMPPDDRFLAGDEIYRTDWEDWDRGFGYSDWYGPRYGLDVTIGFWTFVDRRHFADRDYNRYAPDPREYRTFINNSHNITNYTTVNNIVVNRSVDVREIERESGRHIAEVSPRDVIRNAPIMPVQTGQQVQFQERQLHGGNLKASARDRVAVLPPQNVPGQFTPTLPPANGGLRNQPPQGQANQGLPPNEQFRGRGRGQFGQPNPPPPQGQANQGPPPNEQFRGRGQIGQPNPPPQGQANQGPPPNEQLRGRGQFGQPNPPPQGQANQGPPPNEQFRGRGQFGQPNPPPPQGQANQGPPPNEQFRGRGQFGQPNAPPRGQANQGLPPNEQFRGRGQLGQPNPPPPQGQANQGPPPNEQFRGRGQFGQPNPPPQGQVNQGLPPNEQFRGRGQFGQPNPPPPQSQANQGTPPNEQFRGHGRNEERGAVNAPPPPPPERINPFQQPPQVGPPSQANVQRGRPPEVRLETTPPPQVRGGPPPQAQGGSPPNEGAQRGRGRNQDNQNK